MCVDSTVGHVQNTSEHLIGLFGSEQGRRAESIQSQHHANVGFVRVYISPAMFSDETLAAADEDPNILASGGYTTCHGTW